MDAKKSYSVTLYATVPLYVRVENGKVVSATILDEAIMTPLQFHEGDEAFAAEAIRVAEEEEWPPWEFGTG